jgi:hypothetical protein
MMPADGADNAVSEAIAIRRDPFTGAACRRIIPARCFPVFLHWKPVKNTCVAPQSTPLLAVRN